MTDDFDSQFEDEDFEDENPVEEFDEDTEQDFDDDFEDDFEEEADDESFEEESEDSDSEQEFDKPVDEGDVVEVEIEDLGSKGDGIARIDGFVIFVPGGEVGEKYDVEITSIGRKFAFAEITE